MPDKAPSDNRTIAGREHSGNVPPPRVGQIKGQEATGLIVDEYASFPTREGTVWVSRVCLRDDHQACATSTGESDRCSCPCHAQELRVTTRRGLQRYDAVGLFVQWLAERMSLAGVRFSIEIQSPRKQLPAMVTLHVYMSEDEQLDTATMVWGWPVDRLNEMLEEAGGRGTRLQEEIRDAALDLQRRLELQEG